MGFFDTEDLYKIFSVEDLNGNLKEDYNNKRAHYKIEWAGVGDVVHLWNYNNEIYHSGMRTSHADSVIREGNEVVIRTMNSVYRLVEVE